MISVGLRALFGLRALPMKTYLQPISLLNFQAFLQKKNNKIFEFFANGKHHFGKPQLSREL